MICRICGMERGSVWVEGVCSPCRHESYEKAEARERLAYLDCRIRQQRATDGEMAEAAGLRAGLAAAY